MFEKILSMIGVKRQRFKPDESLNKSPKVCQCPICKDFIVNCILTVCGHSFCEYCLNQSLIYSSLCPLCRKKIDINTCIPSKIIDSYVVSRLNEAQKPLYNLKKQQIEDWKTSKQLKETKVGMKVDVLDTEGIWCSGIIKFKIDNGEKFPFLYIHYIGWDKSFDEVINQSSNRLAPLGFFTSRSIPRYRTDHIMTGNNIL
jgi:Zinc finger, C3HC4 type (RING finger)